uniref:Glutathione S-transferase A-like isoform X3 n=1 Tax=Petromyzon marinus TaxID=7757 RepID=A0AAJ7SS22_PETMA|nr:glutathione S-transferase A-like isoform X3 [Petromyzon marinus]
MASDMLLYWGSGSPPCWRIQLCLEEKALQGYQQKLLSFEKQEHKSAAVTEINPRGQLPSFRHGDNIINESLGACFYLENQFKAQGTKLMPDGAAEQALVLQRTFEVLTLQQKSGDVIYYNWRIPVEERHNSALKRNTEALAKELLLWEGYLAKTVYREVPESGCLLQAAGAASECAGVLASTLEGESTDTGSSQGDINILNVDLANTPQVGFCLL